MPTPAHRIAAVAAATLMMSLSLLSMYQHGVSCCSFAVFFYFGVSALFYAFGIDTQLAQQADSE